MVVREQEGGVDLTVELCGLRLRTPLIPASGTLSKEALGEVGGVYGAMLPKTTTPAARAGNPPPRIAETPAGMVNSIGLQNPGVHSFLEGLDAFVSSSPSPAIPSTSSPFSARSSPEKISSPPSN
jgi:dihydroorotate dehydrogenase (NAD+) catalytic subunit